MSGSLMGGVDSGIALRAGQGAAAPANPLQTLGQFAAVQNALNQNDYFPGQMALQKQAIQAAEVNNAKLANQVTAGGMLDLVSDPKFTLGQLTDRAAAVEHQAHVPTGYFLAALNGIQAAPDTPEWRDAVKRLVATHAQTDASAATAQAFGAPDQQQTGGAIVSGVRAPAYAGGGFSGSTTTPLTLSPESQASQITHPATEAEAKALGIAVGTPVTQAQATLLRQQGLGHLLPNGGVGPQASGAAPASGGVPGLSGTQIANAKQVYDGLIKRGMDPESALAAAGNFLGEANGGAWNTAPGDGGKSHGLMQINGKRLEAFMADNGGKLPENTSLDANLNHFMKEWRGSHAHAAAAAAKAPTAEGKIPALVSLYEVSGNQPADIARRTQYVRALRAAGLGGTASAPQSNQFAGPGAPTGDSAPAVLDRLRAQQPVTATPLPPPSTGVPVAAGPAPGAMQDIDASNKQFLEARNQQADYPLHIQPLEQAARLLKDAKTGRGQETVNNLMGYIKSLAPETVQGAIPGFDPKRVTDFDQATKYLAQIAAAQPGAQGSDLRTQLASIANPSTHIDNKAAQYVVNALIGMERMKRAQYLDYVAKNRDASGNMPAGAGAGFANHASQFGQDYHPLGFAWDDMPGDHIADLGKSLTRDQKRQILAARELARRYKLSAPPNE